MTLLNMCKVLTCTLIMAMLKVPGSLGSEYVHVCTFTGGHVCRKDLIVPDQYLLGI